MNPTFDPAALVALLLTEIAPGALRALLDDPRSTADAGLRAARRRLEAWTRALARRRPAAPGASDPLGPDALAAALRAAFVAAASQGRVVLERRGGATVAELELDPRALALVETIRELAATLDGPRGGCVAVTFDVWRDDTLARIFAIARHRAAGG